MVKISVTSTSTAGASIGEPRCIEFDVKGFIFDKDGTLLSHDHFVPIIQKRIELLTQDFELSEDIKNQLIFLSGVDPATGTIIHKGTIYIARADAQLLIETFLTNCGYSEQEVKNRVSRVFQQADEQVELLKYLKPLDGVIEFLSNLKQHGVLIAVATHDSTSAAQRQLSLTNIDQYIDLIVGLDYSEHILHKPSPSMLQVACEKFGLDPSTVAVAGDSKNDVLMGRTGGAGLVIAVLGGEHEASDFKNYDAIVDSIAQVKIID